MKNLCEFVDCFEKAAPSGALEETYGRFGIALPDYVRGMFNRNFRFCARHTVDFVRRGMIHAGLIDPETPPPGKTAKSTPKPVKHYPTDYASRVKRLREIEESLKARPKPIFRAASRLPAHPERAAPRRWNAQEGRWEVEVGGLWEPVDVGEPSPAFRRMILAERGYA